MVQRTKYVYLSKASFKLLQIFNIRRKRKLQTKPIQVYAQNLSLFAKLFLDTKSVFFDVFGFKYYILLKDPVPPSSPTNNPSTSIFTSHAHPVGFFSKEKMSWDNNNLACILVFPPWQAYGLGKLLIGVSYELSTRDSRIGGPEKPLSELGRKSYLRFWQARVARMLLLGCKNKGSLTVERLAELCGMNVEDVVVALKAMGVAEVRRKGDGVGISKSRVKEWVERESVDLKDPVDVVGFVPLEDSSDEGEEESEQSE
jgi:hypothetical protein